MRHAARGMRREACGMRRQGRRQCRHTPRVRVLVPRRLPARRSGALSAPAAAARRRVGVSPAAGGPLQGGRLASARCVVSVRVAVGSAEANG